MSKLDFAFGFSLIGLTLFWTGSSFWSYGYVQIIGGQLASGLLVASIVLKGGQK